MIGLSVANYNIVSKIGEGGMGSVYLGMHQTLQRKVAVKVLLPEFINNTELKNRFINEAKILSKLNHHNIVSVYDFLEFQGNLLIIMEYVEGKSLDVITNDISYIPLERAVFILKQLLEGVGYAHRQGIIHRDIKPSNIIIREDDSPKILDFGIAKIIQGDVRLTKTGTKMGSVIYMSPEQILGKEITISTDIYSLGITLFEMLTGKLPYDIETLSEYEIQNIIVSKEFPSIRSINQGVPENVEAILKKALAKNPSDRFLSCEEFSNSFDDSSFEFKANTTKTVIVESKNINQSNYPEIEKESKKKSLITAISAIILIIAAVYVFYLVNSDDNITINNKKITTTSGENNNTKVKEEVSVEGQIKQKLFQWNSDNEIRSQSIGNYYANNVNFYLSGNKSRNYVVNQKKSFFNKWQNITLTISNLIIEKNSESRYTCLFDKEFNVSNNQGDTNNGKVKSRIIFESIDGQWLIVNETDDKTYWTNKNY